MSESYILDHNYLDALNYCQSFHKEPQGITNQESPKSTETILIKQNNIIITLLLSLHKKLDTLEKIPVATSSANIESELKYITGRLGNLNLSKTGKETITRRLPKELKFPR